MNKLEFAFIVSVSSCFSELSQFPKEVCDFIGCQFAFESDFGRSNLAVTNENYCGMRNPLVRISTAMHAGDGVYHWAQYHDLYSCVIDYLLCLQYHKPISTNYDTIPHLSSFLSKFYCPDKNYIDKINLIYQSFKSYKNE